MGGREIMLAAQIPSSMLVLSVLVLGAAAMQFPPPFTRNLEIATPSECAAPGPRHPTRHVNNTESLQAFTQFAVKYFAI